MSRTITTMSRIISSPLTILDAPDSKSSQFSILHILDSCKSIQELKQIHSFIIKTNPPFQTQQLIITKIISVCTKLPSIDPNYIHSLFTQLPSPDISLYNAIIRSLSGRKNQNDSVFAVYFYGELLGKGLMPDNYTYPFVIKGCVNSLALREGEEIHAHVIKNGLVSDIYVLNNLMRLYCVCGVILAARKVFDESSQWDLVSWTTLIQGYVKMGYWKEGIKVFFEMCEMNFRPDEMTMVVVLSACAKLGDLSLGRRIHEYMLVHGVNFDIVVGNALVDMYLKCGNTESAFDIFDKMPDRNIVSWNSMISGLAQQGEFKKALNVFRKMQTLSIKPDNFTLVGVLNSCANLGILELGKWVHAYVAKNRLKVDGYLGNALIDMYAKCGSINEAIRVFDDMKYRDVYTYTSIIVGLALHGQGEKALEIFSEMPKISIKPNEVTYIGVLIACTHVGLVKEGLNHFTNMSILDGLKPQQEHYGCMVDLLGRAGLIDEATRFIKNMPIEPDAFIWGSLLGACRTHGRVEIGESVMKRLLKIENERDGAYVIMSNMYSSLNRWRDALKLRKDMKKRKVKKNPGCSSIEVDGVVYEFRKGDKAHPKAKEIYLLLDRMVTILKNGGYLKESDEFGKHECV